MTLPRRVIKIGGSLLAWPHVWQRVDDWLRQQPLAETIIVVGGGALADAIRELDRTFSLDPRVHHRACIQAMGIHAQLVVSLLADADWLADIAHLKSPPLKPRRWVIDPWPLVSRDDAERSAEPLPASWDVTSDSIAARLAELTQADELTLLKSTLPVGRDVLRWSEQGYVDCYFPQAIQNQRRVRCVCLRDESFAAVECER